MSLEVSKFLNIQAPDRLAMTEFQVEVDGPGDGERRGRRTGVVEPKYRWKSIFLIITDVAMRSLGGKLGRVVELNLFLRLLAGSGQSVCCISTRHAFIPTRLLAVCD